MSKFIEAINEALEDEGKKKRVVWNPNAGNVDPTTQKPKGHYESLPDEPEDVSTEWERKLKDPGYLRWKAERIVEFDAIKTIGDLTRFCNRYGININLDTTEIEQLKETARRAKDQARTLRVELAKKGDIPLTRVDFEKLELDADALRNKIAEADSLHSKYLAEVQQAESSRNPVALAAAQEKLAEVERRLQDYRSKLQQIEAAYQSQLELVQRASGATTEAGTLAKAHQQIHAYEQYRRKIEAEHVAEAKKFIKEGDANTVSPLELALPRVYYFREGGSPEQAEKAMSATPKLSKEELLSQLNSIKRQTLNSIQRSSTIVELQTTLNSFKGPSGEHNISVNFAEYMEAHPGEEEANRALKLAALRIYRRWHDQYAAAINAADEDAAHIPEPMIVAQITADAQARFGHAAKDAMATAEGSLAEKIRSEPPVRQWMRYFKLNPEDHVIIAYGSPGNRQVRQIKLRELHERDLPRILPNLELITHPTEEERAALEEPKPSIQVSDPISLLTKLKEQSTDFRQAIQTATTPEQVQEAISKNPDLHIDYSAILGLKLEPEQIMEKLKSAVLKAYKAYFDEYARIIEITKKTINDTGSGMTNEVERAELRATILRRTRRPILRAVLHWADEETAQGGEDRPWFDVTPGRSSIEFSYLPENKYGADNIEFFTEKGAEKSEPYNVVNPWPTFSNDPDEPIVIGFTGDDGKPQTARFTPADIYKYDLTNRLLNFRIERVDEAAYAFVSNQQAATGIQRWEIHYPWSLYNPVDPNERVNIKYVDPHSKKTEVVEGVTRREVWESGIMQDVRTGAVITGLFRQPDARPIRLKENGAIKYLPANKYQELWGEARKGNPDVNELYEFPPTPTAAWDDNGQSAVTKVLEKGPTTYQDPTKLVPIVGKVGKGVGARYDVSRSHQLRPTEEQFRDTDADFSRRYVQARMQDERNMPLSPEYSDFADPKTNRMLPWVKDGMLRTPLGDELTIHWYGPYLVVDLVWRAPGRLERATFPNVPLSRAFQVVKELWDNYKFNVPSIVVPLNKKNWITCPVLIDENGLKHVMYPTSNNQVQKRPIKQALTDSQAAIKRLFGDSRREQLSSYRTCLQPMRPEDRSHRTLANLAKKNVEGDKCGHRAPHDSFPPTVSIQGDEFTLVPGESVSSEENFGFSMEGLCDRHWTRRFRIISPEVLDAMRNELLEIRDYAFDNLGKDLIKDQNAVKAYLRNKITDFIVKWFGEHSFWHLLVDYIVTRSQLDSNNSKKILFRIQHLYRSMLAMTANLIATKTTFVPKPIEGTSSEMTDEELLAIDTQQLTNFAERPMMKIVDDAQNLIDAGIDKGDPKTDPEATNLPFLYLAIDQIIAYLHNCFLNQEIKASGEIKGDRTIIPFAEITAHDVRNLRALRRAWQDRRYPSFQGAARPGFRRSR